MVVCHHSLMSPHQVWEAWAEDIQDHQLKVLILGGNNNLHHKVEHTEEVLEEIKVIFDVLFCLVS